MAILMGDLRAALVEAGASDELASRAATEVATYENRLASIETRLSLLTWMLASQYALFASVVWLLLRVAAKVGAL